MRRHGTNLIESLPVMPTLDFSGKPLVYAHHLGVPFRPLIPVVGKSLLPKGKADLESANLLIHGDNLHALKALMPQYAGRVDCVCIDPPYNTGSEGWMYNDNVNSPLMRRWLRENGAVDREDLERHDKWLCMMWPRLRLLRELMADDGFIFVFIDDNEQHRLRMMMDEIFGEDNFVGVVAWKKTSGDNKPAFAFTHDNIVIYGKGAELPRQPLTPMQRAQYSNPDNDPRGEWAASDYRSRWTKEERPNLYYAITNPNTGEKIYPDTHTDSRRVWGTSSEIHAKNEEAGKIWWGADGKAQEPKKKRFLSAHVGANTRSVWTDEGSNDDAGRMLAQIFHDNGKDFDNPKPVAVVKRIIQIAAGSGGVVLDAFAGSGTTAHAVLALNAEDKGDRRFILVECEDYAHEITAERIRRVIKGVPKARDEKLRKGLGGRFAYCKLGDAIDEKTMLANGLPDYESLAEYLAYTATGQRAGKIRKGADWFFGEVGGYRMHLIYKPDPDFLRSDAAALDEELAEKICASAKNKGRSALIFAPCKFLPHGALARMGGEFSHLPYALRRMGRED